MVELEIGVGWDGGGRTARGKRRKFTEGKRLWRTSTPCSLRRRSGRGSAFEACGRFDGGGLGAVGGALARWTLDLRIMPCG
jgi:hypothetical protein